MYVNVRHVRTVSSSQPQCICVDTLSLDILLHYLTARYIWFAAVKLEVVLPAVTQPSSAETMVLNTMKHGMDGEL